MKVLLSWLDEWIDMAGRTAESIAVDLESLGHEVESITPIPLENVVVGEVLTIEKHPNADKLHVAQVSLGSRSIQLIFGQYFPVKVGDRLPVAVAPCRLPTGFVVEVRSIRNIDSKGMLAADGELGRNFTTEGILRFDSQVKPGTSVAEVVGWQETVLDLSLTPNRGDLLSLRGVARELAAKWQAGIRPARPAGGDQTCPPGRRGSEIRIDTSIKKPQVNIEAADLCPRYSARLIQNVTVSHAPTVVAGRLGMVGHGHYNSVVDVTNYVMEELGVPLHAFDSDQLTLPLVIRQAKKGEKLELLDSQIYELEDSMLVIADQTGPVALAGIMGGRRTAVTDQTKQILLEAAHFNPESIRRTRTKLNLLSDAAYRFERGTDPAALEMASDRAADLITRGTSAQVGTLSLAGQMPSARVIDWSSKQINHCLGTKLPDGEIVSIFKRLEFSNKDHQVTAPSWRHDIAIWHDLAEEIARLIGYDQLPQTPLPRAPRAAIPDDQRWLSIEYLKDLLVKRGWTEHIGSSFLSKREVELLGLSDSSAIKLANPVSEEAAYLRPTQLISLLKTVAKNPVFSILMFFEIGTIWPKALNEQTAVSMIWTGLELQTFPFTKETLGTSVEQRLLEKFKIRRPVMFSEVPVELFLKHIEGPIEPVMRPPIRPIFRTPSRFQPLIRDIAIVVKQTIKPDTIVTSLKGVPNVVDVELFDQFSGGKLPAGTQSLAFHLLFEHPDRTLTTAEIDDAMKTIQQTLSHQFGAIIR